MKALCTGILMLLLGGLAAAGQSSQGQTAAPSLDEQVFRAIENADSAALAQLLAQGARVDAQNDHGYTPLMAAVGLGHTEMVKLLLDHGANPALRTRPAAPLCTMRQ